MRHTKRASLLLCTLLIALLPITTLADADFDTFLQALNETRKEAALTPPPDITPFATDTITPDPLDEETLAKLVTPPEASPETITRQQAREDAEMAFRIFQASYGAYLYFGGEEAFGAALDAILAEIDAYPDDTIPTYWLQVCLARYHSFIQDGHAHIGGMRLTPRWAPYEGFGLQVWPDEASGDAYASMDGTDYQIINALAQAVRPSLRPNGARSYGLFLLSTSDQEGSLERTLSLLDAAGDPRTGRILLEPMPAMVPEGDVFTHEEIEGIPVCTFRSMTVLPGDDARIREAITQSAQDCQDAPVIILDLRGNTGGNDAYGALWLSTFTGGTMPTPSFSRLERHSPLSTQAMAASWADYPHVLEALAEMGEGHPADSWSTTAYPGSWVENDSVILVLMDHGVVSAGESMVFFLRGLENVVFIGTNTAGAWLSGNVSAKYLPHSGLALVFGQGLSLMPGTENIDGTGFLPDLWIRPAYALDAALALAEEIEGAR